MSNSIFSSLFKKYIMALSGISLVLFIIVHCGLNSLIFLDDGGKTFLHAAHFMGTNVLMRILEVGLMIGFLVHIIDGLYLTYQNYVSRPVKYIKSNSKGSAWYSSYMSSLGILLLLFLIIHLGDFWIPNRSSQFSIGEEIDLFEKMKSVFQNIYVVIIYVLGCIALGWHLLHGFNSVFQSLGINHSKYNKMIKVVGYFISFIFPILFAIMPIAFYMGWIK